MLGFFHNDYTAIKYSDVLTYQLPYRSFGKYDSVEFKLKKKTIIFAVTLNGIRKINSKN